MKEYKKFFIGIGFFVISIFIGFLVWPGDKLLYFKSWLEMVFGYGTYLPSEANWPINISAGKSISRILDFFNQNFPGHVLLNKVEKLFMSNFTNIGLVFAIITIIVVGGFGSRISKSVSLSLAMIGPAIIPGVSFAYYLIVLIPIAALIIKNGENKYGLIDSDVSLNNFSKFHLIFTIAFLLSPFALPFVANPNRDGTINPAFVSKAMQANGPLLVLLFINLLIVAYYQAVFKPTRRKDSQHAS